MVSIKTGVFVLSLMVGAVVALADVDCDTPCLVTEATDQYASAKTPAEKKVVATKLRSQIEEVIAATMTPNKTAEFTSNCINICGNESIRCGKDKKDPACVAKCESTCRAEVNNLSFGSKLYTSSSPSDRDTLIAAIRKTEKAGEDKIDDLSVKCLDGCDIGSAGYNCIDVCYAKYTAFAFAMATPDIRDAIFNDDLEENAIEYAKEEAVERELHHAHAPSPS